MDQREFFAEATEAQRYKLTEVIGKGSYGVVASAVDQFTGARGTAGALGRLKRQRVLLVCACGAGRARCVWCRPLQVKAGWSRGCQAGRLTCAAVRSAGSAGCWPLPRLRACLTCLRCAHPPAAGEKVAIKKITNVFDHVSGGWQRLPRLPRAEARQSAAQHSMHAVCCPRLVHAAARRA